ncbi:MAG: YebC/PmpR family DNA-binding transcriptional regulator [Synechococcales cyanobacterium RU_4_20]|nr:YebC/PmpR family DNA-binding transcriptional regulator [Synechococcales cyanobacterium RU_4_20]NJR69320.1 YebC/PmpR family DNA-binding transcriptional regulator [Synechococcales cyanobacterium CRU_2_2]
MAGHSKWANIKRQKAVVDSKRSKIFTKIARDIIVAARTGLPDPEGNFQLRSAIDKAKAAGIPSENIERAIAKGAGTYEGSNRLESIRYEGYGPGGVAVLIEALTDKRTRTAADLRLAFSKNGGNLGETGCVSWMFEQKGVAIVAGEVDEEALLEVSLEGGAESYELIDDAESPGVEVFTEIENLELLSNTLKARGYGVREVELRWIPGNFVEVMDLEQAQQVLRLMDVLEDLDDVQTVTANFEIPEPVLAEVMA